MNTNVLLLQVFNKKHKNFEIKKGLIFMKNKKQYNEIKQNEIESDNVGENAGGIAMDADEHVEDTTKYGEFISSYFAWLTPERQKKRAKEIDEMTK